MMKIVSHRRASASLVSAVAGVLRLTCERLRRTETMPTCPSCGLPVGSDDQAFFYRGLVLHQSCLGPAR